MKKRILFILIVVLLTGVTAACGKDKDALPVVSVCIGGEPRTMDPTLSADADASSYLLHVFEGLTSIDQELNVAPGVAVNWTVSSDGAIYTFYLNPDARWSDGTSVSADDFVFSWQRLLDPATGAPCAYKAYGIKNARRISYGELPKETLGVTALNPTILQVALESPDPDFLSLMSTPAFFPVRKDIVTINPDWSYSPDSLVGNGPFMMSNWSGKDSMTLIKNEHYWNAAQISDIDIRFFFMTDYDKIYSKFEKGDLLFAVGAPYSAFEDAKKEGTLTTPHVLSTYSLAFNTLKKPFDDAKVRMALSLATDRQYLVDSIWRDERNVAAALVPQGVFDASGNDFRDGGGDYFDPSDAGYKENVTAAAILLAEAGYPDGSGFPVINLIIDDSQNGTYIASSLKQQWLENLGIRVSISTMNQRSFKNARSGNNWDMACEVSLADYNSAGAFLKAYSSDSGQNICKYKNADFDRLLAEALSTTDPSVRTQKWHEAESLLIGRDMALMPLSYVSEPVLTSARLEGVLTSPTGQKYFMWSTVSKKKFLSFLPFFK